MTPAPRAVAFVYALAAAVAITLTGPLLLFNPIFVRFEQWRHDVPALHVFGQATYRVTDELLGDLFTDGDFAATAAPVLGPILDASERQHMRDVGGLVRVLVVLDVAALGIVLIAGRRLRGERVRRGRLLLIGAAIVGGAAIVAALFFAFAFDAAFAAFHSLFFAAGTWQFGADSNLLRLFPQPLWFESSLVAGSVIALSALAVGLIGRRDLVLATAPA